MKSYTHGREGGRGRGREGGKEGGREGEREKEREKEGRNERKREKERRTLSDSDRHVVHRTQQVHDALMPIKNSCHIMIINIHYCYLNKQ